MESGEPRGTGRRLRPTTPDAVDVAMDAVGDDQVARTLLEKHSRLIDAQIQSERLEHGAKRMVIFFRGALGLVALAILLAFAWMAARARADRGLVIEALSVPPDLAQRGLTGEAVAAELADKLGAIDQVAQSFRSPETMKVNWGDDIKIVIPSTGVSIGELDTFLRRQLGGQTIIGGSVYRTSTGLRLTVRAGAHGAIDQTGTDASLDMMVQKAAEGVFEKTQPYRYSKYLEFTGRKAEALAVARRLAADTSDSKERAWAWAQISNLYFDIDTRQAVIAGKRAIKEDPDNALAYLNTSIALSHLGHDGEANQFQRKANELGVRGGGGLSEVGVNTALSNVAGEPSAAGDYAEVLRRLNALSGKQYPGIDQLVAANRAGALLAMHDVTGARAVSDVMPDSYFAAHFHDSGSLNPPQYLIGAALGDWNAAAGFAREQLAMLATEPEGPELARVARERHVLPRLATALALSGHVGEAQAMAASLPLDCVACLAARAIAAGMAGDLAAAERWMTQAEQMDPGLPFGRKTMSLLYFRLGKYDQALAAASRAVAIAPHYADALKARGDALRKLGRVDEAVADYEQAEKAAPRWGRLQIDEGVAAARLGKLDEARAHFARARTMDLSAADKVIVERLAAMVGR